MTKKVRKKRDPRWPEDNFTKVPNEVTRGTVSPHAFRLYCLLLSYNPTYPSYKVIREITKFSKGTIRKAISELYVRVLVGYEKGSYRGNANEYKFITEKQHWDVTSPWREPATRRPPKRRVHNKERFCVTAETSSVSSDETGLVHEIDYKKNNHNIKEENQSNNSNSCFELSEIETLASSLGLTGDDAEVLYYVEASAVKEWIKLYEGVWLSKQLSYVSSRLKDQSNPLDISNLTFDLGNALFKAWSLSSRNTEQNNKKSLPEDMLK